MAAQRSVRIHRLEQGGWYRTPSGPISAHSFREYVRNRPGDVRSGANPLNAEALG